MNQSASRELGSSEAGEEDAVGIGAVDGVECSM
jgi:hypothetical protein